MLTPETRVRVYVCSGATDMRKSFNSLSGLVRSVMKLDPLSGHLFCFFNRKRNFVKILYWDETGYSLWCKKLVQGTFSSIVESELRLSDLKQLLDGIDIKKLSKNKRYYYRKT